MKYLSILIVFTVMFFAGSANAQTASTFNGKSYTYVMKNIDGNGGEIIDQITISGNTITSEKYSAAGYKSGKMEEKSGASNSSQFEVTLKSSSNGTMKYSGVITDKSIDGTILVTDSKGNQTTMAMRGMPTEEWNEIQKMKKEYKEKQN